MKTNTDNQDDDSSMTEETVKINWFRFFSPAVIGMILSVIGVIASYIELNSSGGWSYLGVIALMPVLGMLMVLDVAVKYVSKNTVVIWITELLALGFIYWFWISKFTG